MTELNETIKVHIHQQKSKFENEDENDDFFLDFKEIYENNGNNPDPKKKDNPIDDKPRKGKKLNIALSNEQITELLQIAESHSHIHYLMIKLQLSTGIRCNELVNLTIGNVKIKEKELIISDRPASLNDHGFRCKTKNSNRTIPIPKSIFKELSVYIKTLQRKNGYLFTSREYDTKFKDAKLKNLKRKYEKRSYINLINKYCKECASIHSKTIGSHILRRTFASRLYNANCNMSLLQYVLGHSQAYTTWRYVKQIINPNDMKQFIKLMDSV